MAGDPRRDLRRRRHRRWYGISFITIVVLAWWLLAGAILSLAMPPPSTVALQVGARARIRQPGVPHWLVPTDRLAFDMSYRRGMQEINDETITPAFEAAEWIVVEHGDAVRIVTVDGEAVKIELLEGSYVGRHAWVLPRHLTPEPSVNTQVVPIVVPIFDEGPVDLDPRDPRVLCTL